MVRGLQRITAIAVFANLFLLFQFHSIPASAQQLNTAPRSIGAVRANAGVVGIMSGELSSTSLAMTNDLAQVLDRPGHVRIVPMLGRGPEQSIRDILYLRGTDLGIVRSDILNHFKKQGGQGSIGNRLHFIAKLHNEEVHVLSNMKFLCLDDLKGKRVNFGAKGSGSNITASLVFEAHKIKVKPVYYDQTAALDKLKNGEIDATVIVSGKPSPIFNSIKYTDRVHFLDVGFAGPLKSVYEPAVMSFNDYPDLVSRNETVKTVSVSAVMAVYNWKPQSDRYRKVSTFVDAFFSNFEKLKTRGHHAKWREVNLADDVPGWSRFAAASQWLRRNKPDLLASASRKKSARASFQQFLNQQNPEGLPKKKLTPQEQESLFNQFVGWMNKQGQ